VAGDVLIVSAPREIVIFLFLALVPTILGHTMFNYALKKVPAHVISTSVLGEPVGASILAYLLLADQIPSIWTVVGGALVVTGLFMVLWLGYERIRDIPLEPPID
jgi:drug/metabolite transporter (DMT)-like permease